jgi:hypothetical protein
MREGTNLDPPLEICFVVSIAMHVLVMVNRASMITLLFWRHEEVSRVVRKARVALQARTKSILGVFIKV